MGTLKNIGRGLAGTVAAFALLPIIAFTLTAIFNFYQTQNSASAQQLAKNEQCQARLKSEQARDERALAQGQRLLLSRLKHNTPEADAAKAVEAGDYRMVRAYSMTGFGPIGLECADTGPAYPNRYPLTLGYRVYSDVGCGETFGTRGDCEIEKQLDRYAPRFNRALVSHQRYPLKDICRIPATEAWNRSPPAMSLTGAGFADIDARRPPLTVHEAARRGDIAGMKRFLATSWTQRLHQLFVADPNGLNAVDEVGMTPLRWAIGYGHTGAARWLLSRGAEPNEDDCGDEWWTFTLALRSGSDTLAEAILSRLPKRGLFEAWDSRFIEAAAQGGATRFLKRFLSEPHGAISRLDMAKLPPASRTILGDYQASQCWRGSIPSGAVIKAVDIYQGGRDYETGRARPDLADITLRPFDRPQILFLRAHDSLIWRVKAPPASNLVGVVVLGTEVSRLRVSGPTPQTLIAANGGGCPLAFPKQGERDLSLDTISERMVGLPVTKTVKDYELKEATL